MKRIILILFLLVFIVAIAGAWVFFGAGTAFKGNKETIYIRSTAANKKAVSDSLRKNKILRYPSAFNLLADRIGYWKNIKPGKYEIKEGASIYHILRMLKNGQQTPVNLTITKLRTKEDLAKIAGNKFEFDSMQMISFLNNNDSLKNYGIDAENAMTLVFPDTYTFYWNTTPGRVYKKLAAEGKEFWTKERIDKAAKTGLSKEQAYTLASIVEEETNAQEEKGKVASVYINRLKKGMALQADPTVKFALKDFSLTRIYHKHLEVESPYNTYRVKGLPPGPICTPQRKTLDAVLNAPTTNYYFFVASPEFNGRHVFSETYDEHLQKARLYQQALNERYPEKSDTQ